MQSSDPVVRTICYLASGVSHLKFTTTAFSWCRAGPLEAAGGDWELKGTLGQPDATEANELAGGNWELTGGFWAVLSEFGELLNQIFRDRFEE